MCPRANVRRKRAARWRRYTAHLRAQAIGAAHALARRCLSQVEPGKLVDEGELDDFYADVEALDEGPDGDD